MVRPSVDEVRDDRPCRGVQFRGEAGRNRVGRMISIEAFILFAGIGLTVVAVLHDRAIKQARKEEAAKFQRPQPR